MRTPTDRSAAWLTWRQWLKGYVPDTSQDRPCCGLFRGSSRGRIVPVMIDIHAPIIDEAGELLGPEEFVCTVDGKEADIGEVWGLMKLTPLTEAEYEALQKVRAATREVTDLSKEIII